MASEPVDRSAFNGLNTDAVPDSRIGNQAQRVLNMVPVSGTNIRPRYGCEQVATYRPVINARTDIVDQLPEDINNGVLIVSTNSKYSNAGKLITEIEGVFRFRPSLTADLYKNVQGTNIGTSLYLIRKDPADDHWKFQIYEFFLGTYTTLLDFSALTLTDRSLVGCTYVQNDVYREVRSDPSTLVYSKGLAIPYYSGPYSGGGVAFPFTEAYDLDDNLIANQYIAGLPATSASRFFSSLKANYYIYHFAVPLPAAFKGYIMCIPDTTSYDTFYVVRNDYTATLTDYGGPAYGTQPYFPTGLSQRKISDISPLCKPLGISYLIANRETSGGTEQLRLVTQTGDVPIGGFAAAAFTTPLTREYVQADWATWSDRPDTCLDVQTITLRGRGAGNVVALLGNWAAPTFHKVLTEPRLAILSGPQQSIVWNKSLPPHNVTITEGLDVLGSHADQSVYVAHGMVVNQHGDVYTVGTGDFVGNHANHLICKYNPWNMTIAQTSVSHTSNGLGDYYADPLDTHICNIMVDGAYVMVLDHDPEKTRLFVYDYDLNFISKATLSTANASPTDATLGTSAVNTVSTGVAWTDPENAIDTVSFASVALDQPSGDSPSDYLDVTDFGFDIPDGSVIEGITVSFNHYASDTNNIKDSTIQLIVGGSATGENKATSIEWPGTSTLVTYGGSTDLWTLTPTAAQVSASNFGVRIAALAVAGEAGTAYVNSVKIAIAYTPPLRVRANKYSTRFFAENY